MIVTRRLATFLASLSLALAAPALAQTTVTLQQGLNSYTGTTDTRISAANPAQIFGNSANIGMAQETSDSLLVRFNIFVAEGGPVPDGATITSATLSMYKWGGPSAVIKASRLLKDWNESQTNWTVAAGATNWTTAGALSAGNDYQTTADGQGTVGDAAADGCGTPAPATCWLNIDVTAGVQAFSGGTTNRGWKLAQVGGTTTQKNFNSSENTANPTLRPKLTITYTTAPPGTTQTLQQGLNSYAGTTDARISQANPAQIYGASSNIGMAQESSDSLLVRFNIFAAEGGPVPNGATISSATLSMYKWGGPGAVIKASRLLKDWNETQTNWTVAAGSTNWTTAGALSAGSDYLATADGQGSVGDAVADACESPPGTPPAACWVNIDVTPGVQAFAGGTANRGWKLAQVGGTTTQKNFTASENTGWPTLRPKLTIIYSLPSGCSSGALRPYDAAPVNGNPIPIAAAGATSFEAEHFNCGGEGIAYHDNVAGNAGGQFRPSEDVDIIDSTDSAGGAYVVNNFYTGEWLTYTINVAQAGTYDLAIRAANDSSPAGAFHVEIDGANVTGSVLVPVTGSLSSFQWVTKTGVALSAGQHVLKLVSDQQFFHVNQLRVTAGGGGPSVPTAQLSASPASGTAPLTVTFNASGSTDGGSPITNLRLQFGDGSPDVNWSDKDVTQQNQYAAGAAPYTATLTVTNSAGNSAPVTRQIQATEPSGSDILPATPAASPPLGTSVPTFHSMSLYYDPASAPSGNRIFVRFRKADVAAWNEALPMWFDPRTTGTLLPYPYPGRGSVVNLQPNTKYFFEFGTGASHATATWHHHVAGTTWSETFPEDPAVTTIQTQSGKYSINAGGTPTAYKVYDGQGTAVINGDTNAGPHHMEPGSGAINVNASYVIVRGVKVQGAFSHAVFIADNVSNVVIEDSEFTDFSWVTDQTHAGFVIGAHKQGNGISANNNNSRIVIQRNRIHTPHYGANPWDWESAGASNHPEGPAGVHFRHGGQQNVVRYNEIYSNAGPSGSPSVHRQWFIDGIGGADNFSDRGSPGADSDVYGNIVKHVMDDGIELEGGGRNVRVWGNYIDQAAVGMATTVAHFGPLYAWRNVVNRLRHRHLSNPDADNRNKGFKSYGVNGGWGGGRKYFFHNSFLQQPGSTWSPPQQLPLGAGFGGIAGADSFNQGMRETITRNNIIHVWNNTSNSLKVGIGGAANDFDYDIYNGDIETSGVPGVYEPNGFRFGSTNPPAYKSGHGWASVPALGGGGLGNYQLQDSSVGRNFGTVLPNFNDATSHQPANGAPDTGAHEQDAPPMKFGVGAGS